MYRWAMLSAVRLLATAFRFGFLGFWRPGIVYW